MALIHSQAFKKSEKHFFSFPEETFDTKGKLPRVKDNRVNFIKGYFQYTLIEFLANFIPKNQIIVHIDVDLYTSSLFVLTSMDKHLTEGAMIIFDEFSSAHNEFKSFKNYSESYRKEYQVVGAVNDVFDAVAIRVIK